MTFPVLAADVNASTPAEYPGIAETLPIPVPPGYTRSSYYTGTYGATGAGLWVSYAEGLDIGYRWYDAQNLRLKAGFPPELPSLPSLYSVNDALKLAGFPASYLAGKPSHSPYLHENNHQTKNPLFPFLYNGFRGSLFTQTRRLRRHSGRTPLYS